MKKKGETGEFITNFVMTQKEKGECYIEDIEAGMRRVSFGDCLNLSVWGKSSFKIYVRTPHMLKWKWTKEKNVDKYVHF